MHRKGADAKKALGENLMDGRLDGESELDTCTFVMVMCLHDTHILPSSPYTPLPVAFIAPFYLDSFFFCSLPSLYQFISFLLLCSLVYSL